MLYLTYRYTDASNYKQYGTIALTAALSAKQVAELPGLLDGGEFFDPAMIGIDPLPYSTTGTDQDHPWHTFPWLEGQARSRGGFDPASIWVERDRYGSQPAGPFTPDEFMENFRAAKAVDWLSALTTENRGGPTMESDPGGDPVITFTGQEQQTFWATLDLGGGRPLYSIGIQRTDDGVGISIYPSQGEMGEPVASTWATDGDVLDATGEEA